MLDAGETKVHPFVQEEHNLCPAHVIVRRLLAPGAAKEAVCVCVCVCTRARGVLRELVSGKTEGRAPAVGSLLPQAVHPLRHAVSSRQAPWRCWGNISWINDHELMT